MILKNTSPPLDRLIDTGKISVVRLPVARERHGSGGVAGVNRRVLIDFRDLDALIEASKAERAVLGAVLVDEQTLEAAARSGAAANRISFGRRTVESFRPWPRSPMLAAASTSSR